MKVSISEPSATEKQLEIEVPQDKVTEAYNSKIDKYRKEIHIKGFRPGKVPKNIIAVKYGAAIRQEATEETIDSVIKDEFKKAKITPVSQPTVKFEGDEIPTDKAIAFTVTVEVDPEIEIKDYQNLGIEAAAVVLEEKELEEEISKLKKSRATEKEVDKASDKGDVIIGDYLILELDGEQHPIPENPEFKVEVGASVTPEFDEALIGLKKDEEKEIKFTYPEDYQNAEFAGKSATFKIKVKSINEMVLPELNDDFAKELGFENVEDFNVKTKENLLSYKESAEKRKAHEEAIDKLIEVNPFDVPKGRIAAYAQSVVNQQHQGQDQEPVEPTEEEIENVTPEAIREIKKHRILEFVSNAEKIKVRQADVDERIKGMAAMYGMTFKDLKANLRSSGRTVQIREELKLEKTLDFLIGIREETSETKE